jgi:hypothetical protein
MNFTKQQIDAEKAKLEKAFGHKISRATALATLRVEQIPDEVFGMTEDWKAEDLTPKAPKAG